MMKNNRIKNILGFTLIELLAVIIILAILALIAIPIVINTIETSRKNAFKESVNGTLRATEIYETKQEEVYTIDVLGPKLEYTSSEFESGELIKEGDLFVAVV